MKFLFVYLYLFFLLFGPKILGVVDTSIIANAFLFYFLGVYNSKLNVFVSSLLFGIFFIILCYMGVAVYYESFDIVFVGRLVRSFCSVICLYKFCEYFANYSLDQKLGWLVNVVMIHAILVILSATVFVDLQSYLIYINDFGARIRQYRSTGLMAGFDISGLICNIGVALVLVRKRFYIVEFFIFVTAVIFTSRFSIVSLFFILLFYVCLMKLHMGKIKFVAVLIPLFVAGFVGTLLLAFTTSIVSDSLFSSFSFSADFIDTLVWTYHQSDIEASAEKNFVFPNTFCSLIFGLGFYGGTDPGYFRVINCVGLFGLLLMVSWHVVFFYNVFMAKLNDLTWKKEKIFIESLFILVIIFLDLKNSYFFTGTFFEMMLFVSYNFMIESSKQKIILVKKEN